MVAVPARQLRNRLLTHRTDAILFPPKEQQAAPTLQGIRHLHAQTSFEVALPLRVIRVSLSFHFDVPFDGRVGQSQQPIDLGLAMARNRRAIEPQRLSATGVKYFWRTHPGGLCGCRRLAQHHRAWKMAWSILAKVALLITWR